MAPAASVTRPLPTRREARRLEEDAALSARREDRVRRSRPARASVSALPSIPVAPVSVTRPLAEATPTKAPAGIGRSVAAVEGAVSDRGSLRHRMLQRFATVGAMGGVALILVSTTVPATAFTRVDTEATTASVTATGALPQELSVEAIAAPTLTRDTFTASAVVQQVQVESGDQIYSFANDPNGAVQWPFPAGAPIASGFGPRQVAGCGFCSTYHNGLDFTPGAGTEIHSMAAGVVTLVENSGSGLGSHVYVDHVINGQKVQSVYAHMQLGSIRVAVGDVVAPGQVVGLVGSTGASTGAHLHMEIHLDGTPVDPTAWLEANAR